MVLSHDIIAIFTGTNMNHDPVLRVVADNGSSIRPTLIDGNFLRHAIAPNGFG